MFLNKIRILNKHLFFSFS